MQSKKQSAGDHHLAQVSHPEQLAAAEPLPRKAATVSLLLPLVFSGLLSTAFAANAGNGMPQSGGVAEHADPILVLTYCAQNKDLEAMYWLAMLHIEGKIESASYDRRVELLRAAAEACHPEAERIHSFLRAGDHERVGRRRHNLHALANHGEPALLFSVRQRLDPRAWPSVYAPPGPTRHGEPSEAPALRLRPRGVAQTAN
jgi:hypothetical protein